MARTALARLCAARSVVIAPAVPGRLPVPAALPSPAAGCPAGCAEPVLEPR